MKKVTYEFSNLFSLKKYKDSNLNCQSYEYMTVYGIRSTILGQVIVQDGLDKAEELFHKIKNTIIYIQYPEQYKTNSIQQKRYANSYYSYKDVLNRDKLIKNNFCTTMGFRQYQHLPDFTFYIDNSIPDIERYLKGIDWFGASEGLVYCKSIEEVNRLENVLVLWDRESDVDIYENYDWDKKIKFENVYMYSDKYKHKHKKMICGIRDEIIL